MSDTDLSSNHLGIQPAGPSTFHRFIGLPPELRVTIWLLATPRQTRFILLDPGVCQPAEKVPDDNTGSAEQFQKTTRVHGQFLGPVTCFVPPSLAYDIVSDEEGAGRVFSTWSVFPKDQRLPSTLYVCHESLDFLTTYCGKNCSSPRYTRMPRYLRTPTWPHFIVEMRCPFISYEDDIFVKGRHEPKFYPFQRYHLPSFWPPMMIDEAVVSARKAQEISKTRSGVSYEAVGIDFSSRHHSSFNIDNYGRSSGCIHVPKWSLKKNEAFSVFETHLIRRIGITMRNWVYRNMNVHRNGGRFDTFPGLKEVAVFGDHPVLTDVNHKVTSEFDGEKIRWDDAEVRGMIEAHKSHLAVNHFAEQFLQFDDEPEEEPHEQPQEEPEDDDLESVHEPTEDERQNVLTDRLNGELYVGLSTSPYKASGSRRYLGMELCRAFAPAVTTVDEALPPEADVVLPDSEPKSEPFAELELVLEPSVLPPLSLSNLASEPDVDPDPDPDSDLELDAELGSEPELEDPTSVLPLALLVVVVLSSTGFQEPLLLPLPPVLSVPPVLGTLASPGEPGYPLGLL
ncbi:hypothetical protein CMQ_5291 [Grosmannia clavigera kw1407]|uniref:2EXR domain-containing protein n=1 Tax=Grosmannia clavigera (strain kw1407 / UAMH 11150) TaxID=655863 RepID=F0XBL7_GROCL|nr:uncharacterized protein CMQ_5291 [Grosmannia clavigera kw1407]EFX05029.1 hypothetical protein CMQ_5291 [Grosmannia clavigera kw1407]